MNAGEVVHACPPVGEGLTPCCGRTPFELPHTDRLTVDEEVTCPGDPHHRHLPKVVDRPEVVSVDVAGQTVQVRRARLLHSCPFKDETDVGTIDLAWDTGDATVELHSLRAYLDGWAGVCVSHEDLTAEIHADLAGLPGITRVLVSTHWTTAGMEVSCSTSGTPADPK